MQSKCFQTTTTCAWKSKYLSIVLVTVLFAKEVVQAQWRHWQVSAFPVSQTLDPALIVNRAKAEKHKRVVGLIGKMVLKNFLEFVLLKEQVDSKFALVEKRVNFLFDVQLKREESIDTDRCWMKVEGNEDDIRRAKVGG